MDLSHLEPVQEARRCALKHPGTGEMLEGVFLMLYGADNRAVVAADNAQMNRRLDNARERAGGTRTALTAEEMRDDTFARIIAATASWGGIELDGKAVDQDTDGEGARTIYTRLPWAREQAQSFVESRANFLKASSRI